MGQAEIDHLLKEVSKDELERLEGILSRLGLKPGVKPPPKPKKTKLKGSLQTYNLRVLYECQLCMSTSKTTFVMEANENGDTRVSRRTDEDLTPFVLRREMLSSCQNCQSWLETQPKEKLIELVLKIVRRV